MNFRAVATLTLQKSAGNDSTDTAAQAELDLAKYYVNPGKREMKAIVTAIKTSSDSGTFDYKLQSSTTTVDSDFADITGAAITQVPDSDEPSVQEIHFFTSQQYLRGYQTIAGGTWAVSALVQTFKRDA